MEESYDFLGIEKPLIQTEEDLLNQTLSLKTELGKKYFALNSLERILDKKPTKRKIVEIKLFYDEEGIRSYLSLRIEQLKKINQEVDIKILELEQELKEETEIKYDLKEHTIEGPDLRPWPMIYFNLVAVEEPDKNSNHYKHKGYKRYKNLVQKELPENEI